MDFDIAEFIRQWVLQLKELLKFIHPEHISGSAGNERLISPALIKLASETNKAQINDGFI